MGRLNSYIIISRALVESRLNPDEFEMVFLSVFRGEGDLFAPHETHALHLLFSSVDAYCGDPEIRDEKDIDGAGLIAAATAFLAAVEASRDSLE